MTQDFSKTKTRDKASGITKERSSHWPAVMRKFLKSNPVCAACGSKKKLNVHHKKPFHLFPELELDESNLITLCMDPDMECHIKLGHGGDFKAYNPKVDIDVKMVHENRSLMEEVCFEAKKDRLYE